MKKRRFTQSNKIKLFLEKLVKSNVFFYKCAFILKTFFLEKFFYESDLDGLKKIKFKKKTNCVDIGSNVGQSIEFFKNHFNKIYGFEPYKENYEFLKRRYDKNKNIIIKNFGLSNIESKRKLFVPIYKKISLHQSSSFYKNEAIKTLKEFLNINKNEIKFMTETVKSKRFEKLNIKNFSFVKIDAEGHEFEILKGFGKLLHKDVVILIENSTRSFRKCQRYLSKKKFKPYSFENNYFKKVNLNSLNVYFFKINSKYVNKENFYVYK